MAKLYVVMGKSATGKDTIYQMLLDNPEQNLKRIVPYTTRPVRAGEAEGREYHFVSEETMKQMEEDGKIIECRTYQTVHGPWHYFTADDGQIEGEQDCLLIGTLEGYEKLARFFGPDRVVPIYIEVPDGIRLERALRREQKQAEPKYAEMCRRFLADEKDFSEQNLRRLGIDKRYVNLELSDCLGQIRNGMENIEP
ncbi:guanylate kinase [Anaerolentibacter hominis]|uniref:guanylate kinase n=1 Tax=Anaerolentibacter hominis TaxID=3079009 RepID=UPI0031B80877